jgi:outer membrane protein OmpA-like peptidoglycan-associated protein
VRVHTLRRAPLRRPLTIVFIGSLSAVSAAHASDGIDVEARAAVGIGNMLSTAQRDQGYRTGFVPDLRPALRVNDRVAAELALSSWFFPRDAGGTGRATLLGAGARFDPRLTTWLTWFVDGHAGVGLTGANNRLMADGGTGFDIWLQRNLAVGPYLRYGQVVDSGPDPRFWAAGISATMTLASGSDEPPALGASDPDREERQREWERNRQRERQSPRVRDRDGDGIADDRDICPDEKPGPRPDPNMLGCPMAETAKVAAPASGDRDGDGVPDRDDKCPTVAFGNYPDPFAMGCPLADKDHDGVPDMYDACPGKPGVADSDAKRNGCPAGGGMTTAVKRDMVTVNRDSIHLAHGIGFGTNTDNILPASFPVLEQLAAVLKETPALKKVSIEGHTDSSLPALQGIELSEKRAEAVKHWLVANGVEADRLTIRGFGDTRPVASNKTAKGRAINARIELVILDSGLSP